MKCECVNIRLDEQTDVVSVFINFFSLSIHDENKCPLLLYSMQSEPEDKKP